MGDKLMKYYQYVGEKVGLSGKIRLAQETKIPSTMAATEPDSAVNMERFKQAIKTITGALPPDI